MTEALEQWQGQVLDINFPLRAYLGGSTESAVFTTEHSEPEPRKAAIKLVRIEPGQEKRELSRAEAAARLCHSRLIRVFQVGLWRRDDSCLLYTAMEHAPENLAEVLAERVLTASEMREVLVATLDVLAYIHRAGFVHGRLKPANIMAVGDQIKISCDGLYPAGDPMQGRKPSIYDAPEASSGTITPAADVWSLAMIMVEGLTQQRPGPRGTEERIMLPASLPSPFLEIAQHCLRKDPQQRWTTGQIGDRLKRSSSKPVAPADRSVSQGLNLNRLALPLGIILPALAAIWIAGTVFHGRVEPGQYTAPARTESGGRGASRRVPQQPRKEPEFVKDYMRPSPFGAGEGDRIPIRKALPREAEKPNRISGSGADRQPASQTGTGRASYFSASANGGLTASGARLNSEELMAAHASYPLGSRVRVTNLANGKTVEVRILDRFPEGPQRIINVSAAAAKELDFIKAGTATVRLELVP